MISITLWPPVTTIKKWTIWTHVSCITVILLMNEAYIFTLITCNMSTRRTKTYSTHSAYVTCQQGGQKHIHTQHMSHVNKEDKNIFYTLSICHVNKEDNIIFYTLSIYHVNKEDKNIFYTLSICHMSTRRTKTYSTHSAYVMSIRRTKTYSAHSGYVTCQQGGQNHILHTEHMSHVKL